MSADAVVAVIPIGNVAERSPATPVAPKEREESPRGALRLLGAAVLVCVAVSLQQKSGVNPDVAWFAEVAQRTANGTPMYLDAPGSFVEINPPLVVWMLMPAVWLATRCGLWITAAPALLVTAEAIIGIGLAGVVVRRAPRDMRWMPWLIAIVALDLPAHDFAQREHQLFLLLVPALLALAVAPTGDGVPRWVRIAVGLSAGLGLSLKPHFAIAWLLIEIIVAVLDGRLRQLARVENKAAVSVICLYGLSILVFTPSYLRLISVWGPPYLQMMVQPVGRILAAPESLLAFGALGIALCLRHVGLSGRVALVFGVASVAFVGVVVVQHKGFNYHYFPAFAFACCSVAASAASCRRSARPKLLVVPVAVLSTGIFYLAVTRMIFGVVLGEENRRLTAAYTAAADLPVVHGRADGGQGFVVLSTNLVHAFPMTTNMGVEWPLRFPHLWPLMVASPAACAQSVPRWRAIERRFLDDLWVDLTRSSPEVIVVAPLPEAMHPHPGCATVAEHLSRDPRFAALFARYVAVDTIKRGVHGPFVVLSRSAKR